MKHIVKYKMNSVGYNYVYVQAYICVYICNNKKVLLN